MDQVFGDGWEGEDFLEREGEDDTGSYESEWIEAEEGGEVELWEDEIEIPPFALPADTTVGIGIPPSALILYELSPAGLAFQVPVTLTLSYARADTQGLDETTIHVLQWNGGSWQNLGGTVDLGSKTVTVLVTFFGPTPDTLFSRYALADQN